MNVVHMHIKWTIQDFYLDRREINKMFVLNTLFTMTNEHWMMDLISEVIVDSKWQKKIKQYIIKQGQDCPEG